MPINDETGEWYDDGSGAPNLTNWGTSPNVDYSWGPDETGYTGLRGTYGDQPGDFPTPREGTEPTGNWWESIPNKTEVAKYFGLTAGQLAKLALAGYTLNDLRKSRAAQRASQVPMYKYQPGILQLERQQIAQAPRAAGQGAVGQSYFTPARYTAKAAEGGVMGLARGGLRDGSFIIPADVVSHFGNGSSEAGLEVLSKRLGATPIKGKGDGMSDSIDTTIEGQRPAKVAHEEAIVSPEKVTALGKGDPKKGAKVLYDMMDRVRKARTGTKKQGKQIKPEKFMPGGIAGYAGGGAVAFTNGGAANAPAVNTNLTAWSGPYVLGPQGYLSTGFAAADEPYQKYEGDLSAGASSLQTDAFNKYKTLTSTGYKPTTFTSGYTPPANYKTGTFNAGFQYTPVGFNDAYYQAPENYKGATFDTGLGKVGSVESYINPYMQNVVDIQAREARRQADIDRLGIAGRLSQAGAYGGSRQAIMESEQRRNLQQQIGDIQAKGSKEAYDNALARQLAVSNASMEAQRQAETSRQYGYGQKMTARELQARYGLDADKAQALERQFKSKTAADFLLDAQKAAEASRQYGYGQQMTAEDSKTKYGLDAQKATELSKQFGAKFGLDALNSQLIAGATQRAIEADAIAAQKAQFDEQRKYLLEMAKYKQALVGGLPIEGTPPPPLPTFGTEATKGLIALSKQYPEMKNWLKSMGIDIPD